MSEKKSSSKPRVISAFAMLAVLILLLALGKTITLAGIYICGFFICDELLTNFLKKKRGDKHYLYSMVTYASLVLSVLLFSNTYLPELYIFLNLILCVLQLIFLFEWQGYSVSFLQYLKRWKFFAGLFVFLPVHSLGRILHYENWRIALIGILLTVALVDSFAWFFGRKFGKTPLFPEVSPNKTQEGALSGLLLGILGMYVYAYMFLNMRGSYSILTLCLICSLAIIGDLVQSKLKRRFGIKDSSRLIPGHGGVYDRTDSILFIAPIYLILVV